MDKATYKIFISLRRLIYKTIARMPFLDTRNIAIFCYHSIASNNWRFSSDLEEFKGQVRHLIKSRYPVTAKDIYLHISGQKAIAGKSFLICFDDGYKDIIKTENFLSNLNIRPIVFVLADSKMADASQVETSIGFLNYTDLRRLLRAGWEIGCHSKTHRYFGSLSKREILDEIVDSKKKLERDLGIKIDYFAYPKGIYNKNILKAVKKAGYKMAFSMDGGFITKTTDLFKIPRIGVDKTHTFSEFPAVYSTPVLLLRKLLNIIKDLKK